MSKLSYYDLLTIVLRVFVNMGLSTKDNHILAQSSCNDKTEKGIIDLISVPTVTFESIRLNLFNHVLALFHIKFTCILAIRYPVFRWELCKGSV